MSWLQGRAILITGGATGLGREVASLPPGVVIKEALVYRAGT